MALRAKSAENVTGTIVVGYDEREVSRDALALARLLAETTSARLVVAMVLPYEVRQMGWMRTVTPSPRIASAFSDHSWRSSEERSRLMSRCWETTQRRALCIGSSRTRKQTWS